jgi:hypothetical protein
MFIFLRQSWAGDKTMLNAVGEHRLKALVQQYFILGTKWF